MLERNPCWSRMLAFAVVLLVGLALASSGLKAAPAAGAGEPAAAVAMEMNAVTLELVCRDGATEGEFRPIRARMQKGV